VHEAIKNTPDYQIWPRAFKLRLDQHENLHRAQMSAVALPNLSRGQDQSDLMRGQRAVG
jgi:hypothetical protein